MSFRKFTVGLAASASLLVGLAPAAQAADSPTFAVFRDLCVTNRASVSKVIAKADGQGWQQLPAGSFDTSELKEFSRVEVRIRNDNGMQLLLAGEGAFPMEAAGGEMEAELCMVGVMGADGQAILKEAQAFAGVPKNAAESDDNTTLWIYSTQSGRRTDLSNATDEAAVAAVRKGTVESVMVEVSDGLVMIGFIIPRL